MAIRSYLGTSPILGANVYVDESAQVIGDVSLGDHCSVWPNTVIRGDMQPIRIGARSSIQDGSILHITHAGPYSPEGFKLNLGERVTVGHQVTLHGCTIEDEVLIGMGAIIMDGAWLESRLIIGAGSLVPPGKRLASGYLYVGSPVRQARRLTEQEMQYFVYTSDNYVKLKDNYLATG